LPASLGKRHKTLIGIIGEKQIRSRGALTAGLQDAAGMGKAIIGPGLWVSGPLPEKGFKQPGQIHHIKAGKRIGRGPVMIPFKYVFASIESIY